VDDELDDSCEWVEIAAPDSAAPAERTAPIGCSAECRGKRRSLSAVKLFAVPLLLALLPLVPGEAGIFAATLPVFVAGAAVGACFEGWALLVLPDIGRVSLQVVVCPRGAPEPASFASVVASIVVTSARVCLLVVLWAGWGGSLLDCIEQESESV
jgi:hypothetical protein